MLLISWENYPKRTLFTHFMAENLEFRYKSVTMNKACATLLFSLLFCVLFSAESRAQSLDSSLSFWERVNRRNQPEPSNTRFLVGMLGSHKPSQTKVTHILVAGSGLGVDSDQFFQSALLRAKIYQKLYPTHQVIIASQPDVIKASQEEVFRRYNVRIVATENKKFTAFQLHRLMSKFQKIASFDFYGHSSPWALRLGKRNASLYATSQLASLKENFIPGAYATLNGCNAGFELAPALSELWHIPVSGALTGTMFERLQADGHWYKKPDRTASEAVTKNRTNFDSAKHCYSGVCWRLKAQRYDYASYWGNFSAGGLSFHKTFCRYPQAKESCLKGMAKNLISQPSVNKNQLSPSWSSYEDKIFDQLCSTAKDPNYFQTCREGIIKAYQRGDHIFQAHPGNALNCDFSGCEAKVVCDRDSKGAPVPGSCFLKAPKNQEPKTLVNEYQAYKEAFSTLY
jgi:hypothetical protein